MNEKNLLKLIKELGLTQAEVIDMINEKAGKDKELLTQEEKAHAETKAKLEAKTKAEKEKEKYQDELNLKKFMEKEKKKAKDKTPPSEEFENPIMKQLDEIQAKLDELEKSGKVPGKEPSDSKSLEKGALPESTTFSVQKNMFEVDV